MADYICLEQILAMDFRKMRVWDCESGKRADDQTIRFFVQRLNMFFSQFTEASPTEAKVEQYHTLMQKITEKINHCEYEYFLKKYKRSSPEHAEVMAEGCKLKSFKDIPKRMQYWAASFEFGGSIRNPGPHKMAVKDLERWADIVDSYKDEPVNRCLFSL